MLSLFINAANLFLRNFKIFAWNQYMDFKPQLCRIREHNKAEIDTFDEE